MHSDDRDKDALRHEMHFHLYENASIPFEHTPFSEFLFR